MLRTARRTGGLAGLISEYLDARNDEWTDVVARLSVVLDVRAVAVREGLALPAPAKRLAGLHLVETRRGHRHGGGGRPQRESGSMGSAVDRLGDTDPRAPSFSLESTIAQGNCVRNEILKTGKGGHGDRVERGG